MTVLEKIKEIAPKLTPKQGLLARFIVENYKDIAFLSSTNLAMNAGVSEATITRLAYALGYPGYSELQNAIQELFKTRMSTLAKYKVDKGNPKEHLFRKVISMEKSIMDEMMESVSDDQFDKAVDLLSNAEQIIVVGALFQSVVAEYAAIYLNAFKENISKIVRLDADSFNSLQDISSNSVALVFSFPRYPTETLRILELLHEKGIAVIGITDNILSPISAFSNNLFIVPQKFISFIDPYAAVMSFIHALMVAVFLQNKDSSLQNLQKYDDFLMKHKAVLLEEFNLINLI